MTHTDSELQIPARGVVLVTGKNGSGKSAFFEAVAYALFGKSIRGTTIWSTGFEGKASVEVETHEGLRVRREPKTLSFSGGAAGVAQMYETATKALEALSPIVGDLDTWRMTSVFSAADMSAFTLATDTGRKEILEGILGLHRFEEASKRALADQRDNEVQRSKLEVELGRKQGQREGHGAALHQMQLAAISDLHSVPGSTEADHGDLVCKLKHQLREMTAAKNSALEAFDHRIFEVMSLEREARNKLTSALEHTRLARSGGVCNACGAQIPPGAPYVGEPVEALQRLLNEQAERANAVRVAKRVEADKRAAELDALEAEIRQCEETLQRVRAGDKRAKEIAKMAARISDLDEQVEELEALIRQRNAAIDTIKASVQVIRGVRGVLLSDALAALESLAASYLALIGEEYAVKVGTDEGGKVTLSVARASDGRSYRACSAGERRRVDLAVLLALGDLAAAARGVQPGTVILDECLDSSLDDVGLDAAVKLIEQTARDRAVVVITHNPLVIASIDDVASYRIANGSAERLR